MRAVVESERKNALNDSFNPRALIVLADIADGLKFRVSKKDEC
jgi:hypothetical protein